MFALDPVPSLSSHNRTTRIPIKLAALHAPSKNPANRLLPKALPPPMLAIVHCLDFAPSKALWRVLPVPGLYASRTYRMVPLAGRLNLKSMAPKLVRVIWKYWLMVVVSHRRCALWVANVLWPASRPMSPAYIQCRLHLMEKRYQVSVKSNIFTAYLSLVKNQNVFQKYGPLLSPFSQILQETQNSLLNPLFQIFLKLMNAVLFISSKIYHDE